MTPRAASFSNLARSAASDSFPGLRGRRTVTPWSWVTSITRSRGPTVESRKSLSCRSTRLRPNGRRLSLSTKTIRERGGASGGGGGAACWGAGVASAMAAAGKEEASCVRTDEPSAISEKLTISTFLPSTKRSKSPRVSPRTDLPSRSVTVTSTLATLTSIASANGWSGIGACWAGRGRARSRAAVERSFIRCILLSQTFRNFKPEPPGGQQNEGPWGGTPKGLSEDYFPATTYSPTHLRMQYHRR